MRLTGRVYPSRSVSSGLVLVPDEGDQLWVGLSAGGSSEVTCEAGLPVPVGPCIAHCLAHFNLPRKPCVEVTAPDLCEEVRRVSEKRSSSRDSMQSAPT